MKKRLQLAFLLTLTAFSTAENALFFLIADVAKMAAYQDTGPSRDPAGTIHFRTKIPLRCEKYNGLFVLWIFTGKLMMILKYYPHSRSDPDTMDLSKQG